MVILSNGQVIGPAAINALGDLNPLYADQTYYASGYGLELSGLFAAYAELYRRQVWVSTVIRKLAFSTARLPFVISAETEAGRAPAPETPFAALMARPSPRLDSFALWLWTSAIYDIYGEAYWLKIRDENGRVRELHPLHPTYLTVHVKDDDGTLVYRRGVGPMRSKPLPDLPESDVVPFRNFNPLNTLRGLSNLEPLRQTLLNEDAARRATASWWNKGARPGVLLHHPKHLSEDAQKRLRSQVDDTHGGADNAGGSMILEEGMTATIVQLTAEEMQYIESRKLNREEVCGAYDVPPPVVHILDKATFSNITEQMRSHYRDTMAPRLGLFEAAVDHHLRPDFDPDGVQAGGFELEGVLRGDFEQRAAAIFPLVTTGIFKPSEARPLFGLPDAGPDADKLYATSTLQELGRPAERISITEAVPADPQAEGEAQGVLRGWAPRSIAGTILSAVTHKASPRETRSALVDEHALAMRTHFNRQHAAAVSSMSFDASEWDGVLVETLAPLTEATARAAGNRVARLRGGHFTYQSTAAYLAINTERAAKGINASTGAGVLAALSDPDAIKALGTLFAGYESRADEIAETRVNSVGNFAETEAAKQTGSGTKTWRVNSLDPRAEHAAMDGETVGLDEDFSNGMHFPGDPTAGAEDNANCQCTLDFEG